MCKIDWVLHFMISHALKSHDQFVAPERLNGRETLLLFFSTMYNIQAFLKWKKKTGFVSREIFSLFSYLIT